MTAAPGTSPFTPFLQRQPVVLLDGGLATELEARGHDLAHPLWSSRLLLEAPEEIAAANRAYLEAGADCVATCTYQATVEGFVREGLSRDAALKALDRAVELTVRARDDFMAGLDSTDRTRPLVAASIGPYGAFLADGSEYSGDYGLGEGELLDFHAERFRRFATSSADLVACETVPSLPEARVLARLLDESDSWGWISFSCRDGRSLNDGTPIETAVTAVHVARGLAAVGVNCTRPEHVAELVRRTAGSTGLPIIVYPNSGEDYHPGDKSWSGDPAAAGWADGPAEWIAAGARIVGGCCRIGPATIRKLRDDFVSGD